MDEPDINQFRAVVWRTKVSTEVTPQVEAMLMLMTGERARQELMGLLSLSDRKHFAQTYLVPALDADLVEMTIPDNGFVCHDDCGLE